MPIYIESSHCDELIFLEDAPRTYITMERLYPKVEAVLSTSKGDATFKRLVGHFIDKNGDRLKTPGPQYMIIFADNDKAEYFSLFDTSASEITSMVVDITKKLNGSDFKLLRQNPVFGSSSVSFGIIPFTMTRKASIRRLLFMHLPHIHPFSRSISNTEFLMLVQWSIPSTL